MKAKKRVLSTILSLSSILLVGCNKKTTSSSSCSITTSTPTIESTPEPTPEPTPSKTVEELNKELFENYAITKENVSSEKGTYLTGFKDSIPEQYLNLETIIIPEKIGDISLDYISSGTSNSNNVFTIFSKVKTIKIPSTLKTIYTNPNGDFATAFTNLPTLESIEVDSNNPWYYTKGNCLIQRDWETNSVTLERTLKGTFTLKCGWGDVEIPEEIISTIDNAFNNNSSITSVKLHSKINITNKAFKYLDKLNNIDLNGTTAFEIENNVMYNKNSTIYGAWGFVTIPSSITTLNISGFSSVTNIVLNDTVTTLSDFAFSGTKIKTLLIPASVISIPNNVFDKVTDIENIEIDYRNAQYYVTNNVILVKNTKAFIYAWGDAIIPDDKLNFNTVSFGYCYSLTSLTLHNKITDVNNLSFSSIHTDNFKILNYKGTISEFKTEVGSSSYSLYDLLKKYTTITVNFLKDDGKGGWSIDKSYKMSELESIN